MAAILVWAATDVRCRRPRSTCCWRARWRALHRGVSEQVRTAGGDPELTDLVEMEVRELCRSTTSGGRCAGDPRQCVGGLNGEAQWEAKIDELMDAVDTNVPLPERAIDQPFLMPIEDILFHLGPRHGGYGPYRAWPGEGWAKRSEIVGFRETARRW